MHQQYGVPQHPDYARSEYAQQKCDSVDYLKKIVAMPENRLDVHVTYPMLIIGVEPIVCS